jgi:hypothetical protein
MYRLEWSSFNAGHSRGQVPVLEAYAGIQLYKPRRPSSGQLHQQAPHLVEELWHMYVWKQPMSGSGGCKHLLVAGHDVIWRFGGSTDST